MAPIQAITEGAIAAAFTLEARLTRTFTRPSTRRKSISKGVIIVIIIIVIIIAIIAAVAFFLIKKRQNKGNKTKIQEVGGAGPLPGNQNTSYAPLGAQENYPMAGTPGGNMAGGGDGRYEPMQHQQPQSYGGQYGAQGYGESTQYGAQDNNSYPPAPHFVQPPPGPPPGQAHHVMPPSGPPPPQGHGVAASYYN